MADEKKSEQGGSGKSGGRKRSRRRYFRRKKNKSSSSEGDAKSSDGKKQPRKDQKRRPNSQRNRRRRRRSKSKSSDYSGPSIIQEIDADYVTPESVYVYTHVLRPDQRDNYAFRSEIASGTGRQLDDFQIDLSLIFPEGADPIPQTAAQSVARATAQFKDNPILDEEDDLDREDGNKAEEDGQDPQPFSASEEQEE